MTRQGVISGLEGAGMSQSSATNFASSINFSGSGTGGRSHPDESDEDLRAAAEAWMSEHGIDGIVK